MEEKEIGRREMLGAAAAGAAALGIHNVAAGAEQAQEQRLPGEAPVKERPIQFCVVSQKSLARIHDRTDEEIIVAQKKVDDSMLKAMETMVKAARAGTLEGRAALGLACAAW